MSAAASTGCARLVGERDIGIFAGVTGFAEFCRMALIRFEGTFHVPEEVET